VEAVHDEWRRLESYVSDDRATVRLVLAGQHLPAAGPQRHPKESS
jgi:hypothetical protein